MNDQIKGVADKLAAAGYRALVPDLYRGKVALEANEAEHLMTGPQLRRRGRPGRARRRPVSQGTGSAKVGVTGFCMGGALTILSAVNVPEADAAVVWYGYPPLEYVDASKIKAPLLGHFATDDEAFPIAKVDELEKKLRDANVKFEFHRYHAKHAFANETADSKNLPILKYDPTRPRSRGSARWNSFSTTGLAGPSSVQRKRFLVIVAPAIPPAIPAGRSRFPDRSWDLVVSEVANDPESPPS